MLVLVLVLLLALVLILTLELEQELELVMLLVLNAVAKLGMAAQAACPARLDRRRLAPWLVCCPWLCVAHSDAVPALMGPSPRSLFLRLTATLLHHA